MIFQNPSLIELLIESPFTILFYSILFSVISIILIFIHHLERILPDFNEKQNLKLAKVYLILSIVGLILTVSFPFIFIFLDLENIVNFEMFAFITFVFPIVLAPLVTMSFYLIKPSQQKRKKNEGRYLNNRNIIELVIVYAALSIVASNFHDILWCGTRTNWFTETQHNGYELEIWVTLVGANTYSYVFFVFYMSLHVIFCGLVSIIFFMRYAKRNGGSLLKNRDLRKAFVLAWLAALLWGYGLFVMDSIYWHSDVTWLVATFIWIPLGILLLGYSAKYLRNFELKSE